MAVRDPCTILSGTCDTEACDRDETGDGRTAKPVWAHARCKGASPGAASSHLLKKFAIRLIIRQVSTFMPNFASKRSSDFSFNVQTPHQS